MARTERTEHERPRAERTAGAARDDARLAAGPVADCLRGSTERGDERTTIDFRGDRYRLTSRQADTLRAVGAFRTVPADPVVEHLYRGDRDASFRELRQLERQALVTVSSREGRPRERFVTLTDTGRDLVDVHLRLRDDQRLYAGLQKHRELDHDAALYAVYHKGLATVAERGGTPTRVVLDHELKESLNPSLEAIRSLPPAERAQRLEALAREHDLKVVNGRIPLPDVRIEYVTRDGDIAQLDLEYVTPHYSAETIAEKAQAGFAMYGDGGSAARRVRNEQPSFAAQIVSI